MAIESYSDIVTLHETYVIVVTDSDGRQVTDISTIRAVLTQTIHDIEYAQVVRCVVCRKPGKLIGGQCRKCYQKSRYRRMIAAGGIDRTEGES